MMQTSFNRPSLCGLFEVEKIDEALSKHGCFHGLFTEFDCPSAEFVPITLVCTDLTL